MLMLVYLFRYTLTLSTPTFLTTVGKKVNKAFFSARKTLSNLAKLIHTKKKGNTTY